MDSRTPIKPPKDFCRGITLARNWCQLGAALCRESDLVGNDFTGETPVTTAGELLQMGANCLGGLMDIPILKRLIVDRTPREISSIKCFVVNVQVSNGQWSSNKYTSCFSSFRVYLLYSEAAKITGS